MTIDAHEFSNSYQRLCRIDLLGNDGSPPPGQTKPFDAQAVLDGIGQGASFVPRVRHKKKDEVKVPFARKRKGRALRT